MKIIELAKNGVIDEKYIELYGNYGAKIDHNMLEGIDRPDSKLILSPAIPSPLQARGKDYCFLWLGDVWPVRNRQKRCRRPV